MNNSKSKIKIAAVIPFFNERNTLGEVINKTLKYVDCVIAVDDGSTDDSVSFILDSENVILLKLQQNQGKGFALKSGLTKAIQIGCNAVVTLDADLQHNPDEIPELISQLNKYDIIVGNRLKNLKGMPVQRRLSNLITSFLLTIKTGQKIIDSQCGFRAYREEVIKNVTTLNKGYEAESELLIKASRLGYSIGSSDISTIYGAETSKMKPIRTTFRFIRVLFS